MADKFLAQTVSFCQLCEKKSIKWKCVDCSDLFCDDCKKIHERGKATKKHQVVAVKDLNQELLENSAFGLECSYHHITCTMYCATCNKCTCANCVTDNHKSHTFQDLKALIDKKRKEIKAVLNQLDSVAIPKLQAQHSSMPEIIRTHKESIEFLKQDIMRRGQILKDSVDQITQHCISELARFSKDRVDKFTSYQSDIPTKLKELKDKRVVLKQLVCPTNTEEVTKLITSANLYSNLNTPDISGLTEAEFVPGNLDIQQGFGLLRFKGAINIPDDSLPKSTEGCEMKVSLSQNNIMKTLGTNLASVTSICFGKNTSLWVGCASSRRLELINADPLDKDPPPVMTNVLSFSVDSYGDLFITDIDNSKVRRRDSSTGKLTLVKDFKPNYPVSIYVDVNESKNVLFVGLIDSLTKLSEDSETVSGMVIRMTVAGDIMKTFKNVDNVKDKLLTVPNRLTVNRSFGTLLVIDSTSRQKGRIVALSKEDGSKSFIYDRKLKNAQNPFNPSDLVCLKGGQILICDGSNGLLHVVDHTGRLKMCVDTTALGIHHPWSLAIDASSKLYIGTFTYKDGKQTKDSQKGVVHITKFDI